MCVAFFPVRRRGKKKEGWGFEGQERTVMMIDKSKDGDLKKKKNKYETWMQR